MGRESMYTSNGGVAKPEKVLMHVNKYVHPCERIPDFIEAEDLKMFAQDYTKKKNERI